MPNINILKNVVSRVNSYREQLYNEGLTAAQKLHCFHSWKPCRVVQTTMTLWMRF